MKKLQAGLRRREGRTDKLSPFHGFSEPTVSAIHWDNGYSDTLRYINECPAKETLQLIQPIRDDLALETPSVCSILCKCRKLILDKLDV
jgi:hypothetical protein